MIRLESSGSDCTVEAGFRENSVYSTYTQAAESQHRNGPQGGAIMTAIFISHSSADNEAAEEMKAQVYHPFFGLTFQAICPDPV